jgi:hypothetical protein
MAGQARDLRVTKVRKPADHHGSCLPCSTRLLLAQALNELHYEDSSVRRTTFEAYAAGVDWTDVAQVERGSGCSSRSFAGWRARSGIRPAVSTRSASCWGMTAWSSMSAAGSTGCAQRRLRPRWPVSTTHQESAPSWNASGEPCQTISWSHRRGQAARGGNRQGRGDRTPAYRCRCQVSELVKAAQEALQLHPSSRVPGLDSSEAVKKILGGVSSIAVGVAELRNRGYGSGHGQGSLPAGLSPRRAHLAVNAAITWCQLLFDTLAVPAAPWQRERTNVSRRLE